MSYLENNERDYEPNNIYQYHIKSLEFTNNIVFSILFQGG